MNRQAGIRDGKQTTVKKISGSVGVDEEMMK
jgi:hypothetical protein